VGSTPSAWGSGYVTDIEYPSGFFAEQVPARMSLAATLAGFEPPALGDRFTYCELGCGNGKTSLVLAAINPESEFHAVDFNPAHIAQARDQARLAGLRNITFHECSFDELTGPRGSALPMFDVVTMHGVWTWIAPVLQSAIVAFLNSRFNAGGLLYVSYNTLPAWFQATPLQRLIKEFAAATPERSDLAVGRAVEQLERFAEANIIPERFRHAATRFKDSGKMLPYLAHEYLNEHWQPVYFVDVARDLARAKLNYAASSDLLKNFYNLVLTEQQRALIAEVSSPELRETLKDFSTDNWFRQDVFLRGARRMSERRREEMLAAQTLTLMRPAPEAFEISKPDGTRWRPDAAVYNPVLKALARRPHTVTELLTLSSVPRGHLVGPVELVGMLAGTGVAGLYHEPSAAEVAGARRFNALLDADPEIPLTHGAVIAVPAAHGGITLTAPNYALYRSLKLGESRAPDDLAAEFIKRCKDRGGHPVLDDKVIEDAAEAQVAVTRDFEIKIERLVPLWRTLGML
jgi:SAM-dependent methyltransferase